MTVKGALPVVLSTVKLATGATGAALTVMVCGADVLLPPRPSTFSVAVYLPTVGKVKLVVGPVDVPTTLLSALANVHVSVLKSPVDVLVKFPVVPVDIVPCHMTGSCAAGNCAIRNIAGWCRAGRGAQSRK